MPMRERILIVPKNLIKQAETYGIHCGGRHENGAGDIFVPIRTEEYLDRANRLVSNHVGAQFARPNPKIRR